MESKQFDLLARNLSADGAGRRQILRVLASAALGAMVARIGLPDVSEAKTTHHQAGHKSKHKSQAKRKKHESLHDEGKRKGKGKKDKHHHQSPPVPPLPPGCQNCDECQMCQDGACAPDLDLNGIICQGSGAACGYCQGGQCAPSLTPPCGDGFCPSRQNKCCDDEKLCPDRESSTGFACIPKENCCPDSEQRCGGVCVSRMHCCEDYQPQDCGQCGATCHRDGTWSCSTQKPCSNGTCVEQDECCPGETHCDLCPATAQTCEYDDVIHFTCGNNPKCYCHKSTSGERHCLHENGGGYYRCQVDADCNGFYPSQFETFCNACNHLCYLKGCRAVGDYA
jgi:hypothetical protein